MAEPEGGAHREGVGELVGDAVSQPENEAAGLREGCPDALPVIEMEATLVPEELNDGEGVLEELGHAPAVNEEEPLADTETVTRTDMEEMAVIDALRVLDEDDEMLLDGDDPSKAYSCNGYDIKLLQKAINSCDKKIADKFMIFISNFLPDGLYDRIDQVANSTASDIYECWGISASV